MKLIADKTLGKLVKWLRILGYDTVFWRTADAEGLLRQAHQDGRTLITKDTKLYTRRGVLEALLIREDNPFLQLKAVVHHLHLPIQEGQLFSRCPSCRKVYWAGTHYDHMVRLVERLKDPGP